MTISELIEQLEKMQFEHGDISVVTACGTGGETDPWPHYYDDRIHLA